MTASTPSTSFLPALPPPSRGIDLAKLLAEWAHAELMDPSIVDALDTLLKESPRLSLEQAARRLGISSRTLQRVVATTGKTFFERRSEIRADIACHRLMTTRDKIAAIGYDIGFGSPSHFTLWFRQRVGISPSDLRAHAELHRRS